MNKAIKDMELYEILEVLKDKAKLCIDDSDYESAKRMGDICMLLDDWMEYTGAQISVDDK